MDIVNINKSLVAFLANGGKDVKGILAVYDEKAYKAGVETPTFYKVPASMTVEVDDIVVVSTSPQKRFGFTTNKVVKTGVSPDFNSTATVDWIAGCVNTKAYEDCIAFEEIVINKFKQAEQKQMEEKARKMMESVMGEAMNDLPKLPSS
ncbi:hypothetical protein [Terasakiella pusilla]|uniref:hypothetical protein n=1 Tax=Terasakiella pusilla TaxID=64973 RepID=UPI003AA8D82F